MREVAGEEIDFEDFLKKSSMEAGHAEKNTTERNLCDLQCDDN